MKYFNNRSSFSFYPGFKFILTVFMVLLGWNNGKGQSFDHASYPQLDFDFRHLELTLGLQPQNLNIDGAATYQLQANVSGADTVTLNAARLDISSVTVNDEQVDFSLHNDSLLIPLSQPSQSGENYELYIRYSGSPRFGLLQNSNGTVWTSQLPRAQRHWVPIVDNPHVTLQTTFNISVPAGYTVQASGRKTGQESVSVDVVSYHFASREEIPASGLAFSVGRYKTDSISIGKSNLVLSVEQALTDSLDSAALLGTARKMISSIENELKQNYPYGQLNIVLMEDHNWETKSWGVSTVFLYKNRGSLQAQLLRGLLGQWYGVYQRESQWKYADVMTLHQVLTQYTLVDSTAILKEKDSPDADSTIYSEYGPREWNQWQYSWPEWGEESLKRVIAQEQNRGLKELPKVVQWQDYAEFWYRRSGQPFMESPEFSSISEPTESAVEEVTDSVVYRVEYSLNESMDQVTFSFNAQQGTYNKLTSLTAYEVYPSKTDTSEVTFTGAKDSVIVSISPTVNTVKLEVPQGLKLRLEEYKPASFLINELRNAETVKQRAQAARKLGYHDNNSDLQLAIQDFMNKEVEPEVRASLLRSLGEITKGAAGTEQIFLDALNDQQPEVRNAGLMALQHYPENSKVYNRVEQLAVNADSMATFQKATQVLTTLSTVEEFSAFTEKVIQQDTIGYHAVFAVQELANMGAVDEAVEKASVFLDEEYSYDIRRRGLNILRQHDNSPANWLKRTDQLFTDADPRIRYLFIKALGQHMNQEIQQFLQESNQDEYDARVYQAIADELNRE